MIFDDQTLGTIQDHCDRLTTIGMVMTDKGKTDRIDEIMRSFNIDNSVDKLISMVKDVFGAEIKPSIVPCITNIGVLEIEFIWYDGRHRIAATTYVNNVDNIILQWIVVNGYGIIELKTTGIQVPGIMLSDDGI